ncbi:MAG: helix-turn-helix transcriptional regulator, partial [Anaerolineaceae bacterium]|nr:helix-turn-helix transcriptional regulator [Anaerolineaceae bacterium]
MTNAELAILSLLVERALHGYEIERIIQERGIRDWTEIGFSSIYYLLKKLKNKGLIEAASQPAAAVT